jgi:hypothetical protein
VSRSFVPDVNGPDNGKGHTEIRRYQSQWPLVGQYFNLGLGVKKTAPVTGQT